MNNALKIYNEYYALNTVIRDSFDTKKKKTKQINYNIELDLLNKLIKDMSHLFFDFYLFLKFKRYLYIIKMR